MIRVLIVEDDAGVSSMIRRLIRREVSSLIDVEIEATAEGAIQRLRDHSFDLVISDWNLAGRLKGGDVLEHCRTLPRSPKFFFLSSDERIESCGVAYLTKPCPSSDLIAAIEGALAIDYFDQPKVVREMPLDYTVEAF